MSNTSLRQRYIADSITTASPVTLLVMLYDRLCLDVEHATAALEAQDRETASRCLVHAQDILHELRATLNVADWPAGRQLAALYSFLITELVRANVRQDADRATACLGIVRRLRDTWREAAERQARHGVLSGSV
jgi:flagellar protein FliS